MLGQSHSTAGEVGGGLGNVRDHMISSHNTMRVNSRLEKLPLQSVRVCESYQSQ